MSDLEPRGYIDPKHAENTMLLDCHEVDLKNLVSNVLDIPFLSEASELPTWPIHGILFGEHERPFVNLIVESKKGKVNVFFIVDTGSPHVFISQSTFIALGYSQMAPSQAELIVHGFSHPVFLSVNHFAEVNLIGASFLSKIRGQVQIDYLKRKCLIEMK